MVCPSGPTFATGRSMARSTFSHAFTARHVAEMVVAVHDKRVEFHDGDAELAPGLSVHLIGGHTMGIQSVRVMTQRGWLVLASDATHYYEHFEQDRCFSTVFNVGDALEGYAKLRRLAASSAHIIPGHDPLVMQRYPAASKALAGIAVRLDVEPGQ